MYGNCTDKAQISKAALRTFFSAPFAHPCWFRVISIIRVPAVAIRVSFVFRRRTGVTLALDGKLQIGGNPENWGGMVGAAARSLPFYFFTFPPPGIGFWQNHFTDPSATLPVTSAQSFSPPIQPTILHAAMGSVTADAGAAKAPIPTKAPTTQRNFCLPIMNIPSGLNAL